MIIPTLERQIDFVGVDNVCLFRFSIPSITAGSITDDIKFDLNSPGKIENIRINNLSKNYQFSIRLEPEVVPPSIEEIYNVIGVSESFYDDHVDIWFAKPDTDPNENCLYGVFKNVDVTNATGIIHFEFVLVCY